MVEAAETDLVGRRPEIEAISTFLDEASKSSVTLLIEGPAGIGKTTLWKHATEAAAGRNFLVLTSRPAPSEVAWSFCGVGDLLGPVLDRVLPMIPDPQQRALEAALHRATPEREPSPLAVSLAALEALRALSSSGPVIVAVDDVHWLDEASASALQFSMRRLPRERIAFVATMRDDAAPGAIAWQEMHAVENVRVVSLGPLDIAELGQLLRGRFGSPIVFRRVEELHRVSGGNPFYAVEVARHLLARGDRQAGEGLALPESLGRLLRDRLSALPQATREALLAASAASAPTADLLERVLESDTDLALEPAIRAGVVEIEAGAIRFTNPLFASVLSRDAPPVLLRSVHGKLAREMVDPEERARHLARSATEPNAGVAHELEQAARATRRRGASGAAAELAEAALALTPPGAEAERAERKILAAEYHLDSGNTPRARMLLDEAVASLPPGPQRAAALQRLGWISYRDESWLAAGAIFERALEEAGGNPGLEAALELDRSLSALLSGDLERAARLAGTSLSRAHDLGDAGLESRGAAVVGSVDFLMGGGVPDELMSQALRDETWVAARPTLERPSVAYGVLLKMADSLDLARRQLDGARTQLVETGNERSLPFVLFHLAELECWSGDLGRAERNADEATDIALRTGQEAVLAFTRSAQALVQAFRGRVDETRASAAEALAVAERSQTVPARALVMSVLGFLEISLGDMEGARRHLEPMADAAAGVGIHEPGAMRWIGDAAEALIAAGEHQRVSELMASVERRAVELDRRWALAVSARCHVILSAAEGDLDAAEGRLEEALERVGRLDQPFEAGRTLLVTGSVHRRLKHRRTSRESLERALAIFEELGTPLWSDKARAELSRIGGRAPSSVDLTPTERQIAELVAAGATNDETARRLFMSPKTVEWNLSRIYRKLGVRSRTELARWVGTGHPSS
jgi:ATP/maltotriose-dependent transcriptional regulator MalT